jgi:hypothetical protein
MYCYVNVMCFNIVLNELPVLFLVIDVRQF